MLPLAHGGEGREFEKRPARARAFQYIPKKKERKKAGSSDQAPDMNGDVGRRPLHSLAYPRTH